MALLLSLLSALVPTTASAGGFGGNGPDSPVPDANVGVLESSPAAFNGALASADPVTGAGQASIPFRLEAARGKVQPSLTLHYSSQGGQGEAGVGWGLGLPSIQRRNASGPPNYAADPNPGVTAATDRFVYGGVQLVPICTVAADGTCAAAPAGEVLPAWATAGWTYFRAEVDRTFDRFFWSADHYTWVVQQRSGQLIQLGVPLNSALTGQAASTLDLSACDVDSSSTDVFRWNISHTYDAMGSINDIQYSWATVNGSQRKYLTDIYDTPGTVAGRVVNAYAHHTRLTWLPDQPLPPSFWPRIARAPIDQLLSRVDITSASFQADTARALVRSYAMTYYPRGTVSAVGWQKSLLQSVQMMGACAGAREDATGSLPAFACATLPPTTLSYAPSNWNTTFQNVTGGQLEAASTFADVDGDGYPDLIHGPNHSTTNPPTNTTQYWHNNGAGGFTGPGGLNLADPSLGGGAMPDELFAPLDILDDQPFLGYLGNFALTSTPGIDVLAWNIDSSSNQYTLLSTNTSPGAPNALLIDWNAFVNAPTIMTEWEGLHEPATYGFVDVDGDGLLDWLSAQMSGSLLQVSTGISMLSPSGAFVPAASLLGPVELSPGDNYGYYFDDVSGDGLIDIVFTACVSNACTFSVAIGHGDGTFPGLLTWALPSQFGPEVTAGTAFATLHDVNGDGLADLVATDPQGVWVSITEGITSAGDVTSGALHLIPPPAGATSWASSPGVVRFADVDGSGVDDILVAFTDPENICDGGSIGGICLSGDPFNYDFSYVTLARVDLLGGASIPLLTQIDNGLGAQTFLTYATTASLSAAATAVGTPWATQSSQNLHVVTSVTTQQAGNPLDSTPHTTTFDYAAPVYDKRAREFRGFSCVRTTQVDATNPANNEVTETTYLTKVTPLSTTGSADVPTDTLVGLPVYSTTYAAAPDTLGVPAPWEAGLVINGTSALSTTHQTYQVTALAVGVDGRAVRSVYASATDTWSYASSDPSSGVVGSFTSAPFDVIDTEFGVDGALRQAGTTFPLRGGSGTSTRYTQTTTLLDSYGNLLKSVDNGLVGLDAPIERTNTWTAAGSPGNWIWRVLATVVGGADGSGRTYSYNYDATGNTKVVYATLAGTAYLEQATPVPPANASINGTYIASLSSYDAYGNLSYRSGHSGFGATTYKYDTAYNQLLVQRQVVASASSTLTSSTTYDRGFALPISSQDVDGTTTAATYDAFGRVATISFPSAATLGLPDASPDLVYTYTDAAEGPFQLIQVTQVLDSAGTTRQNMVYTDALGRSARTLSTGGAADGSGTWIESAMQQYDSRGRVVAAFVPSSTTFPPGQSPGALSGVPTTAGIAAQTYAYDPYGRATEQYDVDGTLLAHYEYGALSRDTYDNSAYVAKLNGSAPTYSTVIMDGHGRVTEADERTANGGGANGAESDTISTYVQYQLTGEPTSISRVSASGVNPYYRTMQYDSLGRMVVNIEPNTSIPQPKVTGGVRGWVYAYDLNGLLVGTSDARGCGVNYTYDNIGREVSEDYIPCESTQPTYSAPGVGGVGTEVYNVYDAPEPGEPSANAGANPQGLVGRLAASYSRGEHTNYSYDPRGRVSAISRQMPIPTAETAGGALANRYAPFWYVSVRAYDNANRVIGQSTGADVGALWGARVSAGGWSGPSMVTTTYDARDIPVAIGGSYGPLVIYEQRNPLGQVTQRVYGDAAATASTFRYNGKFNLIEASVERASAPVWWTTSSTYSSPIYSFTIPTTVSDLTYTYDNVNNPTSVTDGRYAPAWPSNQGPVNITQIKYDDRYRVTSAAYSYPSGSPPAQSASFVATDPAPILTPALQNRVVSQTFGYDWQGNVVSSDDDEHQLLQRSSGTATYGSGGNTPNRVQSGTNSQGSYTATYDAAGNLTTLKSTLVTSSTEYAVVTLTYDWDEAGRLRTASRSQSLWQDGATFCNRYYCTHSLPTELSSSSMSNAYLYDAEGQRTWHASNNTGSEAYTLEIFPSLVVNQTSWGTDYARSATSEVPYLVSGGTSLGRVVYDTTGVLPAPKGNRLHVYLQLADIRGSTSSTIDQASGELVEQITYLAQGQTETDYRPSRWNSFREGYRYTGKGDDYDVGLVYYGARYYVPGLGRWASADPLTIHALGADVNPYTFCSNSPFRFLDPDGMDSVGMPPGDDPSTKVDHGNGNFSTINPVTGVINFWSPPEETSWGRVASNIYSGADRASGQVLNFAAGAGLFGVPIDSSARNPVDDFLGIDRSSDAFKLGEVAGVAGAVLDGNEGPAGKTLVHFGRSATKAINLPAWRTIGIDMSHILERHVPGAPLAAGRDLFPPNMSEKAIAGAVRQAYRAGKTVESQGERVLMRGRAVGMTIEMWVNKAEKMIETAYPRFR